MTVLASNQFLCKMSLYEEVSGQDIWIMLVEEENMAIYT